jgi:hypothetical protein
MYRLGVIYLIFATTLIIFLAHGPMKVTFKFTNTDVKKSFMKQLSKLKDVDKSSPFKNISISHDKMLPS